MEGFGKAILPVLLLVTVWSPTTQAQAVINAGGPQNPKLLEEVACPELRTLCPSVPETAGDLKALECVQNLPQERVDALSEDCQHLIWAHTSALLDDRNVQRLIQKGCPKHYDKFPCTPSADLPGQYLSCIIDHRDQVKGNGCREYIQRLEYVAFSDYRLIGPFLKDCTRDIETLNCGRLVNDNKKVSQGETIACLQSHLDTLSEVCRKGVLHLSEIQVEDVKLDKPLFLSCAVDAIRFCPSIPAGSQLVLKCLMKNRNDAAMTDHCQKQLLRREKLIAHDYKLSKGLTRACKEDIKLHHCRRGVSDDKDVRLAQILLCLEGVQKNNTKLSQDCVVEINDHRRMLMEDYKLSPEILTGCAGDIDKFCSNLDAGGKTIHCLMDHARPKKKKERRVTEVCQRALETLVKVADAGEDWRVDPVLRQACKPVVDVACSDTEGGDARVMSCLMEKLGTNFMNADCESALLQIQYFVARDFKLDPQLYRNCKDDAIKFCRAKKTWADLDTAQMDPERGPLILPCLHRYAYHPEKDLQLKQECFQEVKRVMRQRARSVDLIPEVEDECIDDLSYFCFDKTGKGEEMQCLQDNLDKLAQNCKNAVVRFTEEEAAHVELNPVIMAVCGDAMQKHCSNILKTGKDEGEMMECLINYKNYADMRVDTKCRAAIEHFQIISLKNYHFTYKFKEACRPYVTRFCPRSNTKYDVVACLSEVMRNDTIKEAKHSIPKECRKEVRAQLYQQRENIDFDPLLKDACQAEIAKLCFNVPHGSGQVNKNNVLECLQTSHDKLGAKCQHMLFNVKKSELSDSSTDYMLINTCQEMIHQYCRDTDPSKVLGCLKIHKDENLFDEKCHLVVVNRMIEQNLDYRFNPTLQTACAKDIAQYCTEIVAGAKNNEELDGKVVACLKVKFREAKLHAECERQMTEVLHEQALNYKLNPLLQSLCKAEIEVLCAEAVEAGAVEDHGKVEECLKEAFLQQRIQTRACKVEVAELVQEGQADIYADPMLQRACAVDLLKYCSNVQSGNGRLLKCLEIILQDESKALDDDCKKTLMNRMEMFRNAALVQPQAESFGQLYNQVVTSPSKHYFALVLFSFVGFVFIFGLLCGRVSRRTIAAKNK
ncbi:Golgi apparatus protein 1-like isoform X1 [Uranotaenia lowii]|uniref:Golgi apparatus protein 1-like isoform X1 n=1 Tax=Uranotaenia lowii TaxID=190385 RepID=UPI00247B2931|nr:Golgi apparatus protein 1-like isoform X1 [Uranotaenia lowii]XP_055609091.1 Golgi apparatus protein 1-like isoform X1 [Uranotaenia lowii]